MTERIVTDANGRKYITTEPFKPDYNTEAVLVEEMQRMAKRIEELEAMLQRQTARIVDLQTHIKNHVCSQRPWQGLTEEDWVEIGSRKNTVLDTFEQGAAWAADQLEERNK